MALPAILEVVSGPHKGKKVRPMQRIGGQWICELVHGGACATMLINPADLPDFNLARQLIERCKITMGRIPCPDTSETLCEAAQIVSGLDATASASVWDDLAAFRSISAFDQVSEQCRAMYEKFPQNERIASFFLGLRTPPPLVSMMTVMSAQPKENLHEATSHVGLVEMGAEALRAIALTKLHWYPELGGYQTLKNVLGATRIPGKEMDTILRTDTSEHVVVLHGTAMFQVRVISEGAPISKAAFTTTLTKLLEEPRVSEALPACVHSKLPRNVWAEVREKYARAGNEAELEAMDTALCCVILDTRLPSNMDLCETAKFGDGANLRFYDLANLVLFGNGRQALLLEHAFCDGFSGLAHMRTMKYFASYPSFDSQEPAVAKRLHFVDIGAELKLQFQQLLVPVRTQESFAYLSVPIDSDVAELFGNAGVTTYFISALVNLLMIKTGGPSLVVEPAAIYHFSDGRTDSVYTAGVETNALAAAIEADFKDLATVLPCVQDFVALRKRRVVNALKGKNLGQHIWTISSSLGTAFGETGGVCASNKVAEHLGRFFFPEAVLTVIPADYPNLSIGGSCFSPNMIFIFCTPAVDEFRFQISATGRYAELLPTLPMMLGQLSMMLTPGFACLAATR